MSTLARPLDYRPPVGIDIHPACDKQGVHIVVEGYFPDVADPNIAIWDSAEWDGVTTDDAWAQDSNIFYDVTGDCSGIQMKAGRTDQDTNMEAAVFTFELANMLGVYSQIDEFGRLRSFMPGRRVFFYVEYNDVIYPRFVGVVDVWEENLTGADGSTATVRVECVDYFVRFNTELDATGWFMGSQGQYVAERLSFMLSLFSFPYSSHMAQGEVRLRALSSVNTVLEEMHHNAQSDGGVVFIDTDGAFMYLDRYRYLGRQDQPASYIFGDICSPEVIPLHDGDLTTDDTEIVNAISFENVDEIVVTRRDQDSINLLGGVHTMSINGMLWSSAYEAEALAEWIIANRKDAYFRIEELTLWPDRDPPVLYPICMDLRVGDKMRVIRTLPTGFRLDFDLIVEGFTIDKQPDGLWQFRYSLSQAISINPFSKWGDAQGGWDISDWTY